METNINTLSLIHMFEQPDLTNLLVYLDKVTSYIDEGLPVDYV